jgi:hypothetical protein
VPTYSACGLAFRHPLNETRGPIQSAPSHPGALVQRVRLQIDDMFTRSQAVDATSGQTVVRVLLDLSMVWIVFVRM